MCSDKTVVNLPDFSSALDAVPHAHSVKASSRAAARLEPKNQLLAMAWRLATPAVASR
jgi:hypothetical protein